MNDETNDVNEDATVKSIGMQKFGGCKRTNDNTATLTANKHSATTNTINTTHVSTEAERQTIETNDRSNDVADSRCNDTRRADMNDEAGEVSDDATVKLIGMQ